MCQSREDFSVPDIARMDDEIAAAKRIDRLRAEQPVRVGDQADDERPRQLYDSVTLPVTATCPLKVGRPPLKVGLLSVIVQPPPATM